MTPFTPWSLVTLLSLLSPWVNAQSYDFTGIVTAAAYIPPSVTTNGSVPAVTASSTSAPLAGLALGALPSCAVSPKPMWCEKPFSVLMDGCVLQIGCFEAALLNDGCLSADIACQCSKAVGLVAAVEPCIAQNCSAPNAQAFGSAILQICANVATAPANLTDIISSELATATASATSTSQATLGETFSGYAALTTSASAVSSPTPSVAAYSTTPLSNQSSSTSLPAVFTGGASAGRTFASSGLPATAFLLALTVIALTVTFP